MAKDDNRSAAGLRRSAVAERLRLRKEWSALKEIDNTLNEGPSQRNMTKKQQHGNLVIRFPKTKLNKNVVSKRNTPRVERACNETSEVLRGLVVHVDVGIESKALALRAALMALGASVVPLWSNLVTHLVWSEGGCRETRSKARLLACQLVSPLWVEACAAAGRRLPESVFPAASRASDLPSPNTLKRMLKRLEQENVPLQLLESDESDNNRPRLRISSDNDTTDISKDKTGDTTDMSKDKTGDTTNTSVNKTGNTTTNKSPDIQVRVNTAPRRALPLSPLPAARCKRKLFTHKEADIQMEMDTDEDLTPTKQKTPQPKTQRKKKINRNILRKIIETRNVPLSLKEKTQKDKRLRIVLTGMSRQERQEVIQAIKQLNGKIQSKVNRKTTHILLGNCEQHISYCNKCNSPEKLLSQMFSNVNIKDNMNRNVCKCVCNRDELSSSLLDQDIQSAPTVNIIRNYKPRTVNALLGAVRGCRVLHARWALDSLKEKQWVHHMGYEVKHLKKIFEKARVERSALNQTHKEYVYNVFNGIKIRISQNAAQKDAVIQLLTLCGAKIQNGEADVTIGIENGEICSKWVFDSITAARLRTTRRYINRHVPEVINLSQ